MKMKIGLTCLCVMLAGCAHAPSVNVLGAFFPGWMICIVGGLGSASAIYVMLSQHGRLVGMARGVLPLLWAALSVVMTLIGWIVFFKN